MTNERIDVLAVMARALGVINDDITDTDQVADVFEQLREARAAVAELIEAAQRTRAGLPVMRNLLIGAFGEESGAAQKAEMFMRELDAALSRIGGAA